MPDCGLNGTPENESAPSGEAEEAIIETKTSFRKFGQIDQWRVSDCFDVLYYHRQGYFGKRKF